MYLNINTFATEVQLSRALERETKRNDKQIEMVSSIINADRTLIPIYLENSQKSLNEVNRLLKAPVHSSTGYQSKAKVIMGLIHGIKGESAALALDNITDICHEFEGHLTNIGISENVDGHDFVEPTVLLNKLLSFNTLLSDICDSLFGANGANGSLQSLDNTQTSSKNSINWDHLRTFSDEVAERQNKKVNLHIAGLNSPNLPSKLVACANTISSQLIRNAISHGIETPEERKRVNKSDSGIISISLFNVDNGGYRYVFEDDGAGIDFNKVARNAIKKGLISEEKAKKSSKLQLINLLFSSQLSTAENADIDKGRGAGMMAVLKAVKGLGGTISVGTSSAIGTRLIIDFPKQVSSLSTDNEADSVNKKNPIANKINVALT